MNFSETEVINFFECLLNNGVSFIIVGGLAVNFHGFSRSTADIDIWMKDDSDNRLRFVSALKEAKIEGADLFKELPFIAGYTEIVLDSGFHLDLMSDLQFFNQNNFDECYAMAVDAPLGADTKIKMLHVNTLISEKEQSTRPIDQLDAEELKKLFRR